MAGSEKFVLPLRRGLTGYALAAALTPVLAILRGQAAAAIAESEAARPIVDADRMRTALLTAVSHDLRTPLAAAKAAVSCLRSADIELTAEDHDELLATADESLNQLTHLLATCLTSAGGRPGRCRCFPSRPIWRRSSRAASAASGRSHRRSWCAFLRACPGSWSTRRSWTVIANLTANALRYSPGGSPPLLTASARGARIILRVVDHGPGVPKADRDRIFLAFQRLGDTGSTIGVRARAHGLPRPDRSDAWHPGTRGNSRRRPDHGHLGARRTRSWLAARAISVRRRGG